MTQPNNEPNSETTNDGDAIINAIGHYLLDNDPSFDIMPMVARFVVLAEIIDPATGEPNIASIRSTDSPYWTEMGMLKTRLIELEYEWGYQHMKRMFGNIGDGDDT